MMSGLLSTWDMASPPLIGVVDDNETERWLLSEALSGWGYNPVPFDGMYRDVSSFLKEVGEKNLDFIICDNHLSTAGYAGFYGATGLAAIHQKLKVPSVLVTRFQDNDELLLKRWRSHLPVILDKDDAEEQEVLVAAIDKSAAEIRFSQFAPDRRTHRVLMTVDNIHGHNEVGAFIDTWSHNEAIRFPFEFIRHFEERVQKGTILLADINIGAQNHRELFFENIKLAPDPDTDDGLV